ncbi:MAG: transposase [Candidatus Thiodiazotropha sp. (ex Cardiolucina cf. quadrata)]|nr:transposase [Candidatus Thiodiazotropha sp. (ex Cardiolucina cf. quadrata)]
MPRANRILLPGQVWHITHRCHNREFLLKFGRDRRYWHRLLFESRKRFGLCVINYVATSNHIHLLVKDQGMGEIPKSIQLIAGCTAQAYNRRKKRRGAYWEDRYHATAVDTQDYLAQCMVYVDLNMVRAGAVAHPDDWDVCGYREIHYPPKRYRVIDMVALAELLELKDVKAVQRAHRLWVEEALRRGRVERDGRWSDALAVGSQHFVSQFHEGLGIGG